MKARRASDACYGEGVMAALRAIEDPGERAYLHVELYAYLSDADRLESLEYERRQWRARGDETHEAWRQLVAALVAVEPTPAPEISVSGAERQKLPRPGDPITAWKRHPGNLYASRKELREDDAVVDVIRNAWEVIPGLTEEEVERLAAEEAKAIAAEQSEREARWAAETPPPREKLTAPLPVEEVERIRGNLDGDADTLAESHELLRDQVRALLEPPVDEDSGPLTAVSELPLDPEDPAIERFTLHTPAPIEALRSPEGPPCGCHRHTLGAIEPRVEWRGASWSFRCALAQALEDLGNQTAKIKALLPRRECEGHLVSAETGPGTFSVRYATGLAVFIAEAFADWITAGGARNYISMDIHSKRFGGLSITVQRKDGKTAHQLRTEAEERLRVVEGAARLALEYMNNARALLEAAGLPVHVPHPFDIPAGMLRDALGEEEEGPDILEDLLRAAEEETRRRVETTGASVVVTDEEYAALHTNGACTCAGGGRCAWCRSAGEP